MKSVLQPLVEPLDCQDQVIPSRKMRLIGNDPLKRYQVGIMNLTNSRFELLGPQRRVIKQPARKKNKWMGHRASRCGSKDLHLSDPPKRDRQQYLPCPQRASRGRPKGRYSEGFFSFGLGKNCTVCTLAGGAFGAR